MVFLGVFWVLKANSFASRTIQVEAGQTVISNGPYRLVRHPLYSASIVLWLFTPLALGSWVAWPFFALLTPLLRLPPAQRGKAPAPGAARLLGILPADALPADSVRLVSKKRIVLACGTRRNRAQRARDWLLSFVMLPGHVHTKSIYFG